MFGNTAYDIGKVKSIRHAFSCSGREFKQAHKLNSLHQLVVKGFLTKNISQEH